MYISSYLAAQAHGWLCIGSNCQDINVGGTLHHCGGQHYMFVQEPFAVEENVLDHEVFSIIADLTNTSELRQLHYMGGNGKSTVDYIPMYQSLYPYLLTWLITSCAACMASVTSSIGPVTSTISSCMTCICCNPLCSKSNNRSPTGLRYLRILLSSSSISVRTTAMLECSEAAASGSG